MRSNQNRESGVSSLVLVDRMFQLLSRQLGYALIAGGLLLILAAQFLASLPVVTAMALVGRGAMLTLQTRPRTARQDSLVLVNLSIYGLLVSLAIVAQSNAVIQESTAQVPLGMLLDHSLAIVLMLGLVCNVYSRLSQSTT